MDKVTLSASLMAYESGMKIQRTPNPHDHSTFERDFDEARFMKRILAIVLFAAIVAYAIWH